VHVYLNTFRGSLNHAYTYIHSVLETNRCVGTVFAELLCWVYLFIRIMYICMNAPVCVLFTYTSIYIRLCNIYISIHINLLYACIYHVVSVQSKDRCVFCHIFTNAFASIPLIFNSIGSRYSRWWYEWDTPLLWFVYWRSLFSFPRSLPTCADEDKALEWYEAALKASSRCN